MKVADKIISKIALPTIAIAGVLLILLIVISTKGATQENNGYIRVINCVISVPAKTRTQADIESCYTKVEKDLGIKLQRYDTSSYRN
jgi:hypothetical protein